MDKVTNWAMQTIEREASNGLYGEVTISFQAGQITTIKTSKTEKPPIDSKRLAALS